MSDLTTIEFQSTLPARGATHKGYKWYKARDFEWRGLQESGKGAAE